MSPLPRKLAVLLPLSLMLAGSLLLSGCRSDRVTVDPKDPHSPQFAYRMDELALLQMAADDIQNLEKQKQYSRIYEDYTSPEFQQNVSRRRFLIMANCVEDNLGGLQEYDRTDLSFHREKSKSPSPLDVLNRKVTREHGTVEEQMVFIGNGFNFKLNSLYWITKDKLFLECIANSAQIEAEIPPPGQEAPEGQPEAAKTASTTPGATQNTSQPPATQPGSETATSPAKPGETAPGTPATGETAKTESGKPAETQAVSTPAATPAAAPVTKVTAQDIKKKDLRARPAGAGVIIDTRPEAPKPKEESKPVDPAPTQPSGAEQQR